MKSFDILSKIISAKTGSRELDWNVADYLGLIPEHSVREIGGDYNWYRHPGEYSLWMATDAEGRNMDHWTPEKYSTDIQAAMNLMLSSFKDGVWSTSCLPESKKVKRKTDGVRIPYETFLANNDKIGTKDHIFTICGGPTIPLSILQAIFEVKDKIENLVASTGKK